MAGGGATHLVGGEGLLGLAHLLVVERDLEADVGGDLHGRGGMERGQNAGRYHGGAGRGVTPL